jgi:hypothetical protein
MNGAQSLRSHPATAGEASVDGSEPVAHWESIQSARPWILAWRVIFGLLVVWSAGWLLVTKVMRPTRSELHAAQATELGHPRRYVPAHPADRAVLGSIDMDRVHSELLPVWIAAMQNHPYTSGRKHAEQAFIALRDAAGKDANLRDLLDQLHAKVMDGVSAFSGDIRELLQGWNRYLQDNSVPWRVEHFIDKTARGSILLTRSYYVLADTAVAVGGEPQHVMLVTRADRSSQTEAYFGHTVVDGDAAMVVTDRVADFAIQRVWPLLAADSRESGAGYDPDLIEQLRREAAAALPSDTLRELERTAPVHAKIVQAVADLGQRTGCGKSIVVDPVPWNGLSARSQQMARAVAQDNEKRQCDRLTLEDAEALSEMSESLGTDSELRPALQRLTAWVARAVVVHEARHLADDHHAARWERTPRCRSCPSSMTPNERAEVSAYLASLSAEGLGSLALLQACGVDTSQRSANAGALSFILPTLAPAGCVASVPQDMQARARALDESLFGRSDVVAFGAEFPDSLPVTRGSRQAAR